MFSIRRKREEKNLEMKSENISEGLV